MEEYEDLVEAQKDANLKWEYYLKAKKKFKVNSSNSTQMKMIEWRSKFHWAEKRIRQLLDAYSIMPN